MSASSASATSASAYASLPNAAPPRRLPYRMSQRIPASASASASSSTVPGASHRRPSSPPEEIARVTGEAVIIAKANATIQPKPVQLAPVKAYRDRWETPHERDPFAVPMAEKLELLRRVSEEAKKGPKVFSSNATLSLRGEDKYFASTDGSSIQQLSFRSTATSIPPPWIAKTTSRALVTTPPPRPRPDGNTCPR